MPLSRLNALALEVYVSLQTLGEVTTWTLMDLELSPAEAWGLRLRLLACARIYGTPAGGAH